MNNILKNIQTIPGVGKIIAGDFCDDQFTGFNPNSKIAY